MGAAKSLGKGVGFGSCILAANMGSIVVLQKTGILHEKDLEALQHPNGFHETKTRGGEKTQPGLSRWH